MPSPYSPIVLAGIVRMIEFALVALIGLAIYAAYVVPTDGFEWHYVGAIAGVAVLALLAFQIADIYQVQAFRGHEKQYFRLASAWSVVFLIVIGASFFAKAGDQFSRVWLGSFYVVGLLALLAFRRALFLHGAALDPRGPADPPHRHRRRRRRRRSADQRARGQRDSDIRVVGVFDDRGDDRSPDIGRRLSASSAPSTTSSSSRAARASTS